MNPIEKAIKDAQDDIAYAVKTWEHTKDDKCIPHRLILANESMEKALRSMQEVDVSKMEKDYAPSNRDAAIYNTGWNECLEHITENYHLIPKE